MDNKLEGISAETVEAVGLAIKMAPLRDRGQRQHIVDAQAAITALLASGEVAIVKKGDRNLIKIMREAVANAQNENTYGTMIKALLTSGEVITKADHEAGMEKVGELVRASSELLRLKKIKDTVGKEGEYNKLQPIAWRHLKEALSHFTTNHATTGEKE